MTDEILKGQENDQNSQKEAKISSIEIIKFFHKASCNFGSTSIMLNTFFLDHLLWFLPKYVI